MNATMPETSVDREEVGDNPTFTELSRIYERLGLSPSQAGDAAAADLACGWRFGDRPS